MNTGYRLTRDGDEWVALSTIYPSLSWIEPNPVAALDGLIALVRDIERDTEDTGE